MVGPVLPTIRLRSLSQDASFSRGSKEGAADMTGDFSS